MSNLLNQIMADALPRNLTAPLLDKVFESGVYLDTLDLFGIALFAITGALVAARKQQTIVTFAFFALVTGVGGGTMRDLLIGAPVFWVITPSVLLTILAMTLLVWFSPPKWWKGQTLEWLDAAGLAAYSVFGVAKAIGFGVHPIPAAVMGVITACLGGIIRDVLANEPSIILKPEIYVMAALFSSSLYAALYQTPLSQPVAAIIAALAGFTLRALSLHYKLGLPCYGRKHAQ